MLTVEKIIKATKGKLVQGDLCHEVRGVSIDSRSINKNHVFIAIKGERFDGHQFIRQAIIRGARVIVASQDVLCSEDIAVIRVKDTTTALGRIAAWHRKQFKAPVIAITGSTGKTTSKEIISTVLSAKYHVLKNYKTENNHIGVPLTLLKLNRSHDVVVLECGTNQPGDIRMLARMARPELVIFTNIGESHLTGLKTPKGVYDEKIQLIKHMKPNGIIFFNADDAYLKSLKRRKNAVSFGINNQAQLQANQIRILNNRKCNFYANGKSYNINTPARHNVYNALAAILCGEQFKIGYNKIRDAIAGHTFGDGRQHIIKMGRLWLIDDTYNANPVSFQSAINTLNGLNVKGKRIVVCADMLELGSRSAQLHRTAGKAIAQSNTDVVLTVGSHARHISANCRKINGNIIAKHCRNLSEVHQRLKRIAEPGDAVLVKGSRSMRMERTVDFIKRKVRPT